MESISKQLFNIFKQPTFIIIGIILITIIIYKIIKSIIKED